MKRKITARKYEGDDKRCWAIFVGNQSYPVVAGLEKSEIPYYKKQVEKLLKEKGGRI
jgi:hypothetical protein